LLEADFQQFYGLDVKKVDFLRASRLCYNLPDNSRIYKKVSGSAYTLQEYLLDFIALRVENIILGLAGKKKKATGLLSMIEKEKQKQENKKNTPYSSFSIAEFEKIRREKWQAE
jgi:hypothetical protein